MGKAQSKRSVDITTDTKKNADDEITEKMEKIEDLDKKEAVNGDATLEEKQDLEQKDNGVENDKDMTTEKNVDIQASDNLITDALNSVETPKEESGSGNGEEISPLADESAKKSKKEKVKKKWSFRNISFGKKDKQKPNKSEEAVEDETTATKGPEIGEKSSKDVEASQKEKSNDVKENSTELRENGDASEQELNGTEHNEKKTFEEKSNDLTPNLTNNITNEKSGLEQSATNVESSDVSEKTEVTAVTTTINFETIISENNRTVEVSKIDNGKSEESSVTEPESQKDITNVSNGTSAEKNSSLTDATNEFSSSTNSEVLEKIHQNGDNFNKEVVEQSKAQIEVNFNTDNKVSAATLDSLPSTFINPFKAQIHNQDLNTTTKNADENIEMNNEKASVLKFIGTEESNTVSSVRENINTLEDSSTNKQMEIYSLSLPEITEMKKSAAFKNTSEEVSPPPLPISPPPSQVSVFAFTNNEESVKDSVPTNNFETACPLIEASKILPSNLEVFFETTNINDIRENNDISEEPKNNDLIINFHNGCLKDQSSICNEDLQESISTIRVDDFEKKEFCIAAEVINEIADKAVKIVSLQLETNKNIQENNSLQGSELEKSNEEGFKDKTGLGVENIVDCKKLIGGNNASECKREEYFINPAVALNESNDTITDESSLMFSAYDTVQQAHNEMKFLTVDHLNPTKEFGNAKDVKDNANAAEITQDLSVICE